MFPTPEEKTQMLADVQIASECDGLLIGEPVVQDLRCHVRALLAEIELLREFADMVWTPEKFYINAYHRDWESSLLKLAKRCDL